MEILTGLKNLHDTGNYHGNIYHKSILISSTKDAYICGFSYDKNKEASSTKPSQKFYYQTEKQAKKTHYIKNSFYKMKKISTNRLKSKNEQ